MNETTEQMTRDLATVIDERAQPKIEAIEDEESGNKIAVALVPKGTDHYQVQSLKPFFAEYAAAPDR